MAVTRKKLIEVALPLDAINAASRREKSIRHGHPSTLHLWWARRPLAAARAVIFAQMVDDPSSDPTRFPTKEVQERERERLFGILEELVKWESTSKGSVLEPARLEIQRNWERTCADNADHPRARELFRPDGLPAFHDPFAGGGALPLEAQRLGLAAHASDLNPVAVLINKAMIEIPPKFSGNAPCNPEVRSASELVEREWKGAQGLAEDVRYYGRWMRDEAQLRIGHLYPKIEVTPEMLGPRPDLTSYVGRELTVIAWLWARTVPSPNPAFANVHVPLASTFMLSTRKGQEAYLEPILEDDRYRFEVRVDPPTDPEASKQGTKLSRGANFRCLMSGAPMAPAYIKSEGRAGRMGARLMAIVAEGDRRRLYLDPTPEHEGLARKAQPTWQPELQQPENPRWFSPPDYGLPTFGDLFTPRQLVALSTFSDLVGEAMPRIQRDAIAAGLAEDDRPLRDGGNGARAYAEAVAVYLGLSVSKLSDAQSTLCRWKSTMNQSIGTFGRQALPMVWDYSEANVFGGMAGDPMTSLNNMMRVVDGLPGGNSGQVRQSSAQDEIWCDTPVVSTDPPYYDNVGYADLSDYFYVWLRRSLRPVLPDLFSTLAVPKAEELVATPYRHGSKDAAEEFFLDGMTKALRRLSDHTHPTFPVTIYYAFKQSEQKGTSGIASTGWETFLEAVIGSGFSVTGTWPIRTELANRMISRGTNALASSIVLVCRRRPAGAPLATRREFLTALRSELPQALHLLQSGNIAPVDLAQAAIGPGMAIYTRYGKVLDAKGEPMKVREALAMINQILDEALAEQEGEFNADTRWALAWYEDRGFDDGEFGVAETLSKAKNTSVRGLVEAGILKSHAGKVRLLRASELPPDWDPSSDDRSSAWERVHHLIRALGTDGEAAAAGLVRYFGGAAEQARDLAYRLYSIAERKKRAADALQYNSLVGSWAEIRRLAARGPGAAQTALFGADDGERNRD